jgi:hypothetical protein
VPTDEPRGLDGDGERGDGDACDEHPDGAQPAAALAAAGDALLAVQRLRVATDHAGRYAMPLLPLSDRYNTKT